MDADNGLSTGGNLEETGEEVLRGWRGVWGFRMDAGRESGRGEAALEEVRGWVFCRRVGWVWARELSQDGCLPCGWGAWQFSPSVVMPVHVRIPTPLRKLTGDEEVIEVQSGTIASALVELQRRFPGIRERLMDEGGEVRRFVNVYVNEEDIRFLQNQETPLKDGDEVSIIPAIAGG